MTQLTIAEAQQRLPELLDAAQAGQIVIIEDDQGRVFQISVQPVPPVVDPEWSGYPNPGSARGLIQISEGFDEPLEEIDEYTR
ncbi:MAG TPA: hypothetical protein VFJ58_16185 [Armatimonadota bacterium]|nr:hypothetical protein [Armatimonadota bacterium]